MIMIQEKHNLYNQDMLNSMIGTDDHNHLHSNWFLSEDQGFKRLHIGCRAVEQRISNFALVIIY